MLMDGISNVWLEQEVGDDTTTSYLRTVDMVCHAGPCEDYACSLFKTNSLVEKGPFVPVPEAHLSRFWNRD